MPLLGQPERPRIEATVRGQVATRIELSQDVSQLLHTSSQHAAHILEHDHAWTDHVNDT